MLSESIGYKIADVGLVDTPMFKTNSYTKTVTGAAYSPAFSEFFNVVTSTHHKLTILLNNDLAKLDDLTKKDLQMISDHILRINKKSCSAPLVKPLDPGSLHKRILEQASLLECAYRKDHSEFNIGDVDSSIDTEVIEAINQATNIKKQTDVLISTSDFATDMYYPKNLRRHFVVDLVTLVGELLFNDGVNFLLHPENITETTDKCTYTAHSILFIKYGIARCIALCRAYLFMLCNCGDTGVTPKDIAALILSVNPPDNSWMHESVSKLICDLLSASYAAVLAYDTSMLPYFSSNIDSYCISTENLDKNFNELEEYLTDRTRLVFSTINTCMFVFNKTMDYNHDRYDYGMHALLLHSAAHSKIQASIALRESFKNAPTVEYKEPQSHIVCITEDTYKELLKVLAISAGISTIQLQKINTSFSSNKQSCYNNSPFPNSVYYFRTGLLDSAYVPFFVGTRAIDSFTYILIPSTERAASSIRKIYSLPERDSLAVSRDAGTQKLTDYHLANYGTHLARGSHSLIYTGLQDFRSYLLNTEERSELECPINELFHTFTFDNLSASHF